MLKVAWQEEFSGFVDIDSSLECHGVLSDEDICVSVQQDMEPLPKSDEKILCYHKNQQMQCRLYPL